MKTMKNTLLASALSCVALSAMNPVAQVEATHLTPTLGQVLFSKDALVDVAEKTLDLESFRYSAETQYFVSQGQSQLDTVINHLSPSGQIQIEALTPGVWTYIQYLTDIDGDGSYEWLCNSEGIPIWGTLDKDGSIGTFGTLTDAQRMSLGETRTISAYDLFELGLEAEAQRSPRGTMALDGKHYDQSGEIVYCITLSDQSYLDLMKQGGMYQTMPSYYLTLDTLGAENGTVVGAYAFEDVTPFDWFYEGVDFVVKRGLFGGITNSTFGPEDTLTRGMFLQSLYQLAGQPSATLQAYSDVAEGIWYHSAVSWATEVGIFSGTSFRPNENITREELLDMLYQYAKQSPDYAHLQGEVGSLTQFSDWREVSPSYVPAIGWCAGVDIIGERSKGSILPHDEASRAEAAEYLKYFIELQL